MTDRQLWCYHSEPVSELVSVCVSLYTWPRKSKYECVVLNFFPPVSTSLWLSVIWSLHTSVDLLGFFFCLFFSGGKSSEKQKRKKHLLLAWLCVWLSVCMTNWCNLYHSCSVEHHWLNNTFFFLFFCFVLVSLSIFIDNLWYQVCQLMKNHIQMI